MKNKILIISGVSSKKGGSNAALIENVVLLQSKFEFLIIVPFEGSFTQQLRENNIRYLTVNSLVWRHSQKEKMSILRTLKKVLINLVADFKIFKIAKKENVDLIHINVSAIGVGWLPAKFLKKNVIWHLRELNDKDQRSPLDFPRVSAAMFRRSTLVPISMFVEEYYKKYLGENSKFELVSDGISEEQLSKIPNLSSKKKQFFQIVFLGGYQTHKGLSTVIQSLSILAHDYRDIKFHLSVYGSQYKENFESYQIQAKKYGVAEFISFHGFAGNSNDVYSNADIVISGGLEAFGRVAAEGIAAGRIVVGSDQGATTELIDNGINGLIFQYANPISLAKSIHRATVSWKELVNNINKNREQNIQKVSSKRTAQKIELLYKKLIFEANNGK